jgi:hypothetical protein
VDAGVAHQMLAGLVATRDAVSESHLRVGATHAERASRGRLDYVDAVRQPDVSQRSY